MAGFGRPRGPEPREGDDDLLAQREAEEFEASVRAARARAAATPKVRPRVAPDTDEADIEWDDQPDVYRPRRVQAGDVLRSLGLGGAAARLLPAEPVALIRRAAMERLSAHLRTDLKHELGGLLGGEALYDPVADAHVILVEVALPALNGEATPTSFTYTSEAWASILPTLLKMNPDWTIVGSYHSHPGLGVFLSSVDLDTQAEVFPHDWQVAIVIDPAANDCGVFAGASGRPCPFHVI